MNNYPIPEKWCIKGNESNIDIHNWFCKKLNREVTAAKRRIHYYHYPEFDTKACTAGDIKSGYTEITYQYFKKVFLKIESENNTLYLERILKELKIK